MVRVCFGLGLGQIRVVINVRIVIKVRVMETITAEQELL